ncbi:acyltransferase family protein [Pseudarthrobacter sp. NamE5]|uniref:acyltransferase family protein n=1 Tax=Pseudarthrobacter sp. NamE5 TaxID=2576839 RepID=UPI00110B51D5|nr:acyltransferase family protein [Pseudarthrobacter sp. NamE5]TLM85740.1 acyltransferase [Pseudarthrobacter sp. NamE5]
MGEILSTATLLRPQVSLKPSRSYRGDIQGLRSVAILAVFLYHLKLPFMPGGFVGVDVFFVISGYLITGILVRQLTTEGSISLVEFYSRRAKRLLPAATVVLLATAGLTLAFVPVTRWASIGWDVVASTLYVQNWRLAADSVDYLRSDAAPSPLQHFWSLGVEEQYYVVWPLLLMISAVVLTWRRGKKSKLVDSRRLFRVLVFVLCLVISASLIWSVYYTETAAGPAYFASTTRFWQLATGALLAISINYLERVPALPAAVMGWLGTAGIIFAVITIDETVPYPGIVAMVPTFAAALVIASGVRRRFGGPEFILGSTPMRFIGDISYSLYLWHWPFIVIAGDVFGELTVPVGAGVLCLSLLLAYLTYRFVEVPFSKSYVLSVSPSRGLQVGLACMVAACLVGGALVQSTRSQEATAAAAAYNATLPKFSLDGQVQEPAVAFGAMTLPAEPRAAIQDILSTAENIQPAPVAAANDFPDCISAKVDESDVRTCEYGIADSTSHVALVGDSHAKQWIPALEYIARSKGWRLTAYIHDACPFATGQLVREGVAYTACIEWNSKMLDALVNDDRIKMVITSNYTKSAGIAGASDEVSAMAEAYRSSWGTLIQSGISVAVIRDTPAPARNIPDCVAANLGDLKKCAVPRSQAADDKGLAQVAAASGFEGVKFIDLNDFICPADLCAPVIGEVLVYRDSDHLTATYVRSLTPRLEEPLVTAHPRL